MKKYQTPEVELSVISTLDIITSSTVSYASEGAGESVNWADGLSAQ